MTSSLGDEMAEVRILNPKVIAMTDNLLHSNWIQGDRMVYGCAQLLTDNGAGIAINSPLSNCGLFGSSVLGGCTIDISG